MEKTLEIEIEELYRQYRDIISENKEDSIKDYKKVFKKVGESPAIYKGKAVEFLYQPIFFTEEDHRYLEKITNKMTGILNKVIDRYIEDEKFRSYFPFPKILEELILKDPGYSINVPIARFDAFYSPDGRLEFCELNADGSSGMVEVRELQNILGQSLPMERLKDKYSFKGFELLDSLAEALLENYKQFSQGQTKPQLAIVDFLQGEPRGEFKEFKKTFEKFGCKAIIADLRDLEYRDNKLYYGDFRIDCIYRRAVTWEIIDKQDKVTDFIRAYLDGKVCVVGPLRSQLIHNKLIFAILHDEEKTSFLNEEERQFIKKHVPYTAEFNMADNNLLESTIDNKDRLVLKPMDKYASKGVCIGMDYKKQEWEEFIRQEIKEEYIVQELCRLPKLPLARVENESIDFIENNYSIGLFVYNEKFQGIYTRTSTTNIIGGEIESYTVPSFIVNKK